jgi:probable HAF family extracellular repeat protein
LEAAVGINDAGQIAGYGQFAGGVYHAFLLTPAGPLIVAITNPAPNAIFTAPATFVVAASASDTAGTVTNVQFLVNGSVIGETTAAPYSATASNLAAGSYTLTAVASDDGGLSATNSIGVTVANAAAAPITISDATFSAGTFSFSFGTETGYVYECQFTTPLSLSNAWVTFTNLTGDGSAARVTDPTPTDTQRYYRVIAQ